MNRLRAVVSLLAVAMGGCYTTYDPYYYDYVYYDPYWYAYDAYYVYGWIDTYGVDYSSDPTQDLDLNAAAAAIASRASTYYTPAGCAVATASGSTVNYTFARCDGTYGLSSISGAVTLELSESKGQLAFAATSTGLTVGGSPFTLDVKGTAGRSGNRRSVMLRTRSRAPDLVVFRNAQIIISWEQGTGCVTLNGQGNGSRGDMKTLSTITGYRRCVAQCPSSGKVEVEGDYGLFTLEFNGSETAVVKAPDGQIKRYDLPCQ